MKKYKFSVIIPVYNVENYLAETIDSVLNQTIGFQDNIQIILVNDGSPDNSEEICLEYEKLYPQNIKYIKQKNAGVSAARNNGLKYAEGEYINFLDSDDKWDNDVFLKAYKMFQEHNEIDVIGVRQKFFEALDNYPSLDFKFNRDKVVDIFNNFDHIQLSVTSAFIRKDAIGDLRYDTRVKYSEDAKFLIEIILKKEKLGIISSSLHLYRKRFSENSAIQNKNFNDDWYLVTPPLCYQYLFELSKKKYGYVIPYVQFYFTYDLQWRVKEPIPANISDETKKKYLHFIKTLLQDVDDYIILAQRHLFSEYKIETLKFKYGKDIAKEFYYVKHKLYYNNIPLVNIEGEHVLNILTTNFKNGKMELRGFVNCCIPREDYYIDLVVNSSKRYKLDLKETNIYQRKFFNQVFLSNIGFQISIPEKDINNLYFELIYKNKNITRLNFMMGINSKMDTKTKIYYKHDNRIYYVYNRRIKVVSNSLHNRIHFALRSIKNKIVLKKYKILIYRAIYHVVKIFHHKKIWLFSDRIAVANDNGIHLFKYVTAQKNKKIKPYFVLDKTSKDYKKVKKIGKVLKYNSYRYKLYFLMADKIISSQADPWVCNAFGKSEKYYRDLYNFDFIFLQHGIIKDDLSTWLNYYEKNISMFVTSASLEYDSIINGKYGFGKDVVKLTGLPRYDNLIDKSQKIIAIMPTWRTYLSGKFDVIKGIRNYNYSFKKSEYFNFYNNLINDERLCNAMKKKGYKGIFVAHPSHMENYIDFVGNDTFDIFPGYADYQKIFSEAKLLVSDYSSVPFDFAYLNKPVLYTQFDKEFFFAKHLYRKGYFSYEDNGFGPVVYDYDSTVNEIIKFIENDCVLDNKYKDRIQSFYKYHDKNNCKRVYEEILKIDHNK